MNFKFMDDRLHINTERQQSIVNLEILLVSQDMILIIRNYINNKCMSNKSSNQNNIL